MGLFGEARAASGEADFGFWHGDASDGDHADELEGINDLVVCEGCAGHGHEGIDRDAFGERIEVRENFEEAKSVVRSFSETDDAAAADGHACVLDVGDGAEAVVVGVRGDDVRVVLGGGVEVVIVGGDACIAELFCLFGTEFAEGDADFHAELRDVAYDVEDLLEALRSAADAAPCCAHAETCGAGGFRSARAFHDGVERKEAFGLDARVVAGRLGAIGAVLGAAACFDGEEGAELDFGFVPVGNVDFSRFLD